MSVTCHQLIPDIWGVIDLVLQACFRKQEAGPARAMVGRKELDSYAPETSKEKIAPAAVTEWSEISSRIVHARGNFQPITLGLSSVTLPLGTAPRENVLQQKQLVRGYA